MGQIQYKIGRISPQTRDVPVTFTLGDIVHKRRVNAVYDAAGQHDRKATEARVAEVAAGVAHKIESGAIKLEPAETETESAT